MKKDHIMKLTPERESLLYVQCTEGLVENKRIQMSTAGFQIGRGVYSMNVIS